jgi:nucleoside-diphosphate-sugar epimerase
MSIMRAFSGSCLSLDDHDYQLPRIIARKHVLGSGEDLFDEAGRPRQPQPRTLTKVFSGSTLDLNAQNESDSEVSQGVSPAMAPHDRRPPNTQQSFNDFIDNVDRGRDAATANGRTTVLVVGGAGYLASHVIETLLREGYQVRATVPDMRDSAKMHDLYNMVPEAKHMLCVVEANVFNATSLRGAMAGCRFVIHCGVPQVPEGTDVVDGHMEAVMALFDAVRTTDVARSRRVERIVLTGSYTNVLSVDKSQAPTASGLYNETQWNDRAKRDTDPLTFARVSFEKEAVRLAKLSGVELVVILPAVMIGPTRTLEVSEAMRTITDFALCSPYFPIAPNLYWNFVDVRDVATAHVKAMTASSVAGTRLLVAHSAIRLADLGRLIRASFPHLTAPIYTAPTFVSLAIGPWAHSRASFTYLWRTLGVRRVLDGSRAVHALGLQLTPLQTTVHDAVANLIQDGHLPEAKTSGADVVTAGQINAVKVVVALGVVGIGGLLWLRRK